MLGARFLLASTREHDRTNAIFTGVFGEHAQCGDCCLETNSASVLKFQLLISDLGDYMPRLPDGPRPNLGNHTTYLTPFQMRTSMKSSSCAPCMYPESCQSDH